MATCDMKRNSEKRGKHIIVGVLSETIQHTLFDMVDKDKLELAQKKNQPEKPTKK